MSLSNICFEQIRENFHYGKFGEFTLVVDKETGCFNATKLCAIGKKQYKNWFRLDHTKNLFSEIEQSRGDNCHLGSKISYEIKGDNKNETTKKISGTYICKELILDLASWISPSFYLKCNDIVLRHFEREFRDSLKEKDDKIDELLKMMKRAEIEREILIQTIKEQNEKLDNQDEKLDEIQEELGDMNGKLDRALPDRNLDPEAEKLKHSYALFKSREVPSEFVFVRGQNRHIQRKASQFEEKYEIAIDTTKAPNPIDLANRLKDKVRELNENAAREDLETLKNTKSYAALDGPSKRRALTATRKKAEKISYRVNKIRLLGGFTEDELMALIKKLDDEKYEV